MILFPSRCGVTIQYGSHKRKISNEQPITFGNQLYPSSGPLKYDFRIITKEIVHSEIKIIDLI
jgi:hypothetical protein